MGRRPPFGLSRPLRPGTRLAALLLLAGCATEGGPPPGPFLPPAPAAVPLPPAPGPARVTRIESPAPLRETRTLAPAEPGPVAPPGPAAPPAGPPVAFDLRDASLPDMAERIFADILGEPYTIETELPGTLSLSTPGAVPRADLLRLFEALLAERGAALVRAGGFWRIVAARADGPALAAPSGPEALRTGIGYTVRSYRLLHIDPAQMAEILKPLAPEGTVRSVESDRGLIVLAGPSGLLADLEATMALFDADWLARLSVALVPLRYGEPEAVAQELAFALAGDAELRRADPRVLPVGRARAVLVVARSPGVLRTVREMVRLLDVTGTSERRRILVYEVQNRPAGELAALLTAVLGGTAPGDPASPGLPAAPPDGVLPAAADTLLPGPGPAPGRPTGPAVSVTADESANALIIRADPELAEETLAVIQRLDTPPDQVLLEVTIAEVTLSDNLRYGLEWYFRFGDFQGQLSNLTATAPIGLVEPAAPGLSLLLSGTNATVVLNALARLTDLKVISSPSLMVVDNRQARLQIGDQVPVVTQTAVSVDDPGAPIVSQVAYRDTGVTLTVTPRTGQSGQVLLTIEQDVSDVVPTTTSGIDSPTIRQRRIATTVSVTDGQSLALGGLIRDASGRTENGLPFLKDLPVAGALFRTTGVTTDRTELLVLITPRIVRDPNAARAVTAELRDRLLALRSPVRP